MQRPSPHHPALLWDPDSPVVSTKHIDGIFIGYHRVLAAPGDREGRTGSGQDPAGGHLATILGTGGQPPKSDNNPPPPRSVEAPKLPAPPKGSALGDPLSHPTAEPRGSSSTSTNTT